MAPCRHRKTFANVNPADTRDVVSLLQDSDARDVNAAVTAAAERLPGVGRNAGAGRGKILLKAAHLLEGSLARSPTC